jgi:hypothetical protein
VLWALEEARSLGASAVHIANTQFNRNLTASALDSDGGGAVFSNSGVPTSIWTLTATLPSRSL